MEHKVLKKKIISGFAWEGSTKLAIQIVSWITTIYVARVLSPDDYGIVAVSGVFVGILVVITDMGLSDGLINKSGVTQQDNDNIFWLGLLLGLFLYAVLYLAAPFISSFYDMPLLTDIIRVAGVALVYTSLKVVPQSILLRQMNFKFIALVGVAGQLTSAVTVVTMATLGYGPWSLVWSFIALQIVTITIFLTKIEKFPAFRLKIKEVRSIISFGMKIMASRVLEFFMQESSILIIGLMLGQKIIGYYSMALMLATIPMDKLGSIFNRIAFPAISRVKNDLEQSRNIFLEMHRYLLAISYPILVGMMLVADDAVIFLLTDKWEPIIPLLQTLCAINLLRVSGMLMPHTLAGRGKANLVLNYNIASSIILPIAFFIGTYWGIMGIVYAWVVSYPFLYIFLLSLLCKELKIKLSLLFKSIKGPFFSTLFMFIVVLYVKHSVSELDIAVRLTLSVLSGAVAYGSFYMIFFHHEFQQMKRGFALLRNK